MGISQLDVTPPRKGDEWLMAVLFCLGYTTTELLCLTEVWIHQQVLFVSDVVDAHRNALDKRYWSQCQRDDNCSTVKFPEQASPRKDLNL